MKFVAFVLVVTGVSFGALNYDELFGPKVVATSVRIEQAPKPQPPAPAPKPQAPKPILPVIEAISLGMTPAEVNHTLGFNGVTSSRTGKRSTIVWVGTDATLFCVVENGVVRDFTTLGQ